MIFIRDGTRVHKLLMLLACVGEYPMRSVYLLGNDRVWKRKIRELQQWQDFCLPGSGERGRFQMLMVSGKGKNATIRLHRSALPVLKRIGEAAYGHYMEHFNQHHFSGAVTHVSRNHRLAETVAMRHLRTDNEDEALLDVCRKLGVSIPVLATITAKELLEKDFPPRVELIEGMLGPGLYILAGAPKIGKSWLVLQIAHHISTGTPLWDRRVSRHAVLYLSLEDTLPRIQSRLLTICDGETGDVAFSIEAGLLGDGFEDQLTANNHPDSGSIQDKVYRATQL